MTMRVSAFTFAWCAINTMSFCPAAILTFDQFTNAAKTIRTANNLPANQSYGDNIVDFSPAGLVGGQYVIYSSAGGLTPNITVEYRWYYTLDPTDPNPQVNGPGGVNMWNFGYGGLEYVGYAIAGGSPWLSEIRFTPEPGYAVQINDFDYAGYQTDISDQTLKILADPASAAPQLLWSAGADGSVSFPGSGAKATPAVAGGIGQTVSLLWGYSGNSGIDNVSFSQAAIPEPASGMLWLCGIVIIAAKRGRCNKA